MSDDKPIEFVGLIIIGMVIGFGLIVFGAAIQQWGRVGEHAESCVEMLVELDGVPPAVRRHCIEEADE